MTTKPLHAKLMLAIVTFLSAPTFVGLLTKTKVWCAITGRCEVGGASYPDLLVGAFFNACLLLVLYYIVLRSHRVFASLIGIVFLVAACLLFYAFSSTSSGTNMGLTAIDLVFLSSMFYAGCSLLMLAFGASRKTFASDGSAVSSGGQIG